MFSWLPPGVKKHLHDQKLIENYTAKGFVACLASLEDALTHDDERTLDVLPFFHRPMKVRHGERGNFVPGLTTVAVSALDEVQLLLLLSLLLLTLLLLLLPLLPLLPLWLTSLVLVVTVIRILLSLASSRC